MYTKHISKWKFLLYQLIVVACFLFVLVAKSSASIVNSSTDLGGKYEYILNAEGKAPCSNHHEQISLDTPWAKAYNALDTDIAVSIQQTSDGGYIIAGTTMSYSAGNYDVLVMKLDATGNILWQKAFGGINDDSANSVQQTSDGGYIVAGRTNSFGEGSDDLLVIKLNAIGNILWRRTFGGINNDSAGSVMQTSDGGYIVAGRTDSYGAGDYDVLVIKLNSTGNILWRRTFGGINNDSAGSVMQTSDGGYIIAGYTYSYGAGDYDVLVIKLNSTGNILWRRTFGGINAEFYGSRIEQTSDGGYILGVETNSYGAGSYDVLIIKLNATGNILWRRTFGGTDWDFFYSVQQTSDGGYFIAGAYNTYYFDVLAIKLDATANIQWRRTFGGTNDDVAHSAQQTSDGGYIVAGYTGCPGYGDCDILILKFDANGNIPGCSMKAPNLSISAPGISVTAPAIGASAPSMTVTAPSLITTDPEIGTTDICP
ncbi:MAG: hypothetical protein A2Y62_17480 [Candidatus Fischerbacteria bacterium RBG_13_37_8]|uniref:Bulb-type lectin domain-containing protein n=1 Tax=Candidatus Fischerbacteria bacterium RBG_13_37_8 TaxID=1817863 RepID=A0A1F5VSW6_9BACT|nr:MAG: hypothetical protein A2Y62_17480 [Candidatus Fischerbacteria bacterium RBG_13_37_8]